jgi:elongation factor G
MAGSTACSSCCATKRPAPDAAAQRLGLREGGALHVFKIANGGAMGRLALGRVLGAPLGEGDELVVGDAAERTGSLFFVQGEKTAKQAVAQGPAMWSRWPRSTVRAAGMMLGRKGRRWVLALPRSIPRAMPRLRSPPATARMTSSCPPRCTGLCEEDPALEWTQDDASHETMLRGINDDHLQVVLGRLQRRYGVAVDTQAAAHRLSRIDPQTGGARGRHKKQSGGHGQYGDCVIEIRPLARGDGFVFEDKITGGVIPRQYIPAVEAGSARRDGARAAGLSGGRRGSDIDRRVVPCGRQFGTGLPHRRALAMAEALAAGSALSARADRAGCSRYPGRDRIEGRIGAYRPGADRSWGSPHPDWDALGTGRGALLPESALPGLDAELRSLSQGLAGFIAGFDHLAELGGKHADEVIKTRATEAH